jgi:hypothetical protein
MKRGELVILWIGGLLSAALLIIVQAPLSHNPRIDFDEPMITGYIFNVVTKLLAIWIICGLVWLTLYRRNKGG